MILSPHKKITGTMQKLDFLKGTVHLPLVLVLYFVLKAMIYYGDTSDFSSFPFDVFNTVNTASWSCLAWHCSIYSSLKRWKLKSYLRSMYYSAGATVLNRVVHYSHQSSFKSSGAFLAKNSIKEFITVCNFVLQNQIFNFSSSCY